MYGLIQAVYFQRTTLASTLVHHITLLRRVSPERLLQRSWLFCRQNQRLFHVLTRLLVRLYRQPFIFLSAGSSVLGFNVSMLFTDEWLLFRSFSSFIASLLRVSSCRSEKSTLKASTALTSQAFKINFSNTLWSLGFLFIILQ